MKYKSKNQAFEKERKLLNEGSSTITQEYSEKINTLEDELIRLQNENELKAKEIDNTRSELEKVSLSNDELLEEKQNTIKSLQDEILSYKDKITRNDEKLLSIERDNKRDLRA
ncbi:CKB_collapsed_G0008330.mRNA.1.CDS.1 [Saccharomyces cerevisiae]|nr:CKB_collapsed_G0008330.mRNA.1.CDS.1 [Saccharomyces cerevisiae]